MSVIEAMQFIEGNEGFRAKPYKCTAGKTTIGFGRNLEDNGVSRLEAEMMMYHDILACMRDLLEIFPKWQSYAPEKQVALIDMRYNLGPGGFRTFEQMINAIRRGNWREAANQAINSKWFGQVGLRGDRVAALLLRE